MPRTTTKSLHKHEGDVTVKKIKKFVRQQSGTGPSCWPGEPGQVEKQLCIESIIRLAEYNLNLSVQSRYELTYPDSFNPRSILGDNFTATSRGVSGPPPGLSSASSVSIMGAVLQTLGEESEYKVGYNANLTCNASRIPPKVYRADVINVNTSSVVYALEELDLYGVLYTLSNSCYCNDVLNDTFRRVTRTAKIIEDEVVSDDEEETGPETNLLVGDNTYIPDVYGRFRVLGKLLANNPDGSLLVGVAQAGNYNVTRIWLDDDLVYENGITKDALLQHVSPNISGYKDLFSLNMKFSVSKSDIIFRYNGNIYIEIAQAAVHSEEETVYPGKTIKAAGSPLYVMTDGSKVFHKNTLIDNIGQTAVIRDRFLYNYNNKVDITTNTFSNLGLQPPIGRDELFGVDDAGNIIRRNTVVPAMPADIIIGNVGYLSDLSTVFTSSDSDELITTKTALNTSVVSYVYNLKYTAFVTPYGVELFTSAGVYHGRIDLQIKPPIPHYTEMSTFKFATSSGETVTVAPSEVLVQNGAADTSWITGNYLFLSQNIIAGEYAAGVKETETTTQADTSSSADRMLSKYTVVMIPFQFTGFAFIGNQPILEQLLDVRDAYKLGLYTDGNLTLSTVNNAVSLNILSSPSDLTPNEKLVNGERQTLTVTYTDTDYNVVDLEVQTNGKSVAVSENVILTESQVYNIAADAVGDAKAALRDYTCSQGINMSNIAGTAVKELNVDTEEYTQELKTAKSETGTTVAPNSEVVAITYTPLNFDKVYNLKGFKPDRFSPIEPAPVLISGHVIGKITHRLIPYMGTWKTSTLLDDNVCLYNSITVSSLTPPNSKIVDADTVYADPFVNLFIIEEEWMQYEYVENLQGNLYTLHNVYRGRWGTGNTDGIQAGTAVHFFDDSKAVF